MTDRVELSYTGTEIAITAPRQARPLEDRPEFALFLDYLTKESLLGPERLVHAAEFMAGDDALFAGVEIDDLYDDGDDA